MDYYKTSKGNWYVIQKYETQAEAQVVADSFGSGYVVEFYAPYIPLSIATRLDQDLKEGNRLIYVFVEDNRIEGITPLQSELLLVKFRDILGFAQTGAITSIATYLPLVTIDAVFTQERKDKYINMINGYLNQF